MARTFAIASALAAAMMSRTANADATLDHVPYGATQDGQAVDIYTMTNEHGLRVRFLNYGGVITEINAPDRAGRFDNIVLGLGTLREYETLPGHFGAITGRYANRIGSAQFTLNGLTYHLIANNGPNTLHGGPNALDHRVWTVSPLTVSLRGTVCPKVLLGRYRHEAFSSRLRASPRRSSKSSICLPLSAAIKLEEDFGANIEPERCSKRSRQ